MITAIAVLAAAIFIIYTVFFERTAVQLTQLELPFSRLPKSFDGYKIIQLSDTHIGHWGKVERRVEKIVRNANPDIIVVTGDMAVSSHGVELLKGLLARTKPESDVLMVYGNSEHKGGFGKRRRNELQWDGLKVLVNEHVMIRRDSDAIVIAGVDDPFSEHDDAARALEGAPEDAFKILLAHAPSAAGDAVDAGVDLVLSGHTHGGQVRLPLIGAVYPHLRKYTKLVQGLFEGDELAGILKRDPAEMKVYVSRGIGISNLPIRFLCPPEVVLVTLRRKASRLL